jgi:hypothetical protein
MTTLSRFFRSPLVLVCVLMVIAFTYWNTSLSFYPVPWPDDSAFYLAGLDWINWPSHYRMHSQAPFVDTYDQANFNIMPLLPLVFGIFRYLGFDSSHALRLLGLGVFVLYTWILVDWAKKREFSTIWIWTLAFACITTPVLRWGATVARTEIWQALFWILILRELEALGSTVTSSANHPVTSPRSRSPWRIPTFLALAAGFHYEAIVWVLPTAAAIVLQNPTPAKAMRALWAIAWRTLLLMSPWLVYLVTHFSELQTQLTIQFSRLSHYHPYLQDLYGAFHSIFLSMGQPLGYPKFFNAGKIITWGIIFFTFSRCIYLAIRERGPRGPVRLAVALGFVTTGYLWATKPETWFTTLIYAGLWPAFLLSFREPRGLPLSAPNSKTQGHKNSTASWDPRASMQERAIWVSVITLIMLQVGVAIYQWSHARGKFEWSRYQAWVGCIESAIGPREHIWQVNIPDVLVELTKKHPRKDYTRSVDFSGVVPDLKLKLERHARSRDTIIHSLYFRPDTSESDLVYQGVLRTFDRETLSTHPFLPLKEYSALSMGVDWDATVCHEGPFWAVVSARKIDFNQAPSSGATK